MYFGGGFPGGSDGKESACNVGDLVQSMGWEHLQEKRMASHSSILETFSFFFFLIYAYMYLWYRFSDSYFIQ